MEGKHTVAQINARVEKKFPGKAKPTYPRWYHNQLTKRGMKPPPLKGDDKKPRGRPAAKKKAG